MLQFLARIYFIHVFFVCVALYAMLQVADYLSSMGERAPRGVQLALAEGAPQPQILLTPGTDTASTATQAALPARGGGARATAPRQIL